MSEIDQIETDELSDLMERIQPIRNVTGHGLDTLRSRIETISQHSRKGRYITSHRALAFGRRLQIQRLLPYE
ncbi:MAG: hypothetical protein N2442_09015 [Spirochaetes bacterium]|nr:hypothetical protein [Spirochaetota bacterium]